jgi:alpha-glucuronidase
MKLLPSRDGKGAVRVNFCNQAIAILGLAICCAAHAETGRSAWLRYAALEPAVAGRYANAVPSGAMVLGTNAMELNARDEIVLGVRGLLGKELRIDTPGQRNGAFVLGTLAEVRSAFPGMALADKLDADAFWLKSTTMGGTRYVYVVGGDERGVLYGSFALMRKMASGEPITGLDEKQAPYAPVRWVNEWDNLN